MHERRVAGGFRLAGPHVAELVENGWIRLIALDPQGSAHRRFVPGEGWEPA